MPVQSIHKQVVKRLKRDSHGHFIKAKASQNSQNPQNPLQNFLASNIQYSKTQDDLVDIHVGNPLHKIVELLTEIKKEKAFSFTLKGSLGLAGVALVLGVFGVFGGGQILCDRGVQSEIGTVKVLSYTEKSDNSFISQIPLISQTFPNLSGNSNFHNRTVLVKTDNSAIRLITSNNTAIQQYNNFFVIATGNYDSCSQTLAVTDADGLQTYGK